MANIVTIIKVVAKVAGTVATIGGIINSAGSLLGDNKSSNQPITTKKRK